MGELFFFASLHVWHIAYHVILDVWRCLQICILHIVFYFTVTVLPDSPTSLQEKIQWQGWWKCTGFKGQRQREKEKRQKRKKREKRQRVGGPIGFERILADTFNSIKLGTSSTYSLVLIASPVFSILRLWIQEERRKKEEEEELRSQHKIHHCRAQQRIPSVVELLIFVFAQDYGHRFFSRLHFPSF